MKIEKILSYGEDMQYPTAKGPTHPSALALGKLYGIIIKFHKN